MSATRGDVVPRCRGRVTAWVLLVAASGAAGQRRRQVMPAAMFALEGCAACQCVGQPMSTMFEVTGRGDEACCLGRVIEGMRVIVEDVDVCW